MRFVGNSSGEVNSGAERKKIPQAIKLKWSSIGSIDRSEESAGGRIVIVDLAIAKVADPKLDASDQGESPRRIEVAMRNQAVNQVAAGVEDVDEAMPRPVLVIAPARGLFRIGHINLTIEIANGERRKSMRNVWVPEPVWINFMKILIVRFHLSLVEIRHIKKIMTIGHAQGCALVNILVAAHHCHDRMGAVEGRVPA